jgi:hypothetical protein
MLPRRAVTPAIGLLWGPVSSALMIVSLFALGGSIRGASATAPLEAAPQASATAAPGFAISDVRLNVNAENPTVISSVTFSARALGGSGWPAPLTRSAARLTSAPEAWYGCTSAAGAQSSLYRISCDTSGGGVFLDGVTPSTPLAVSAATRIEAQLAP